MENNHRAGDVTGPVVDRRGGIFNGGFQSVAADEAAVHSQSHGPIWLYGHLHGVESALARGAIDNPKDFGQRLANGFFAAPPSHSLRNKIEIGDIPGNIGAENGVANRVEGDPGALFFYIQCTLDGLAFDRMAQRARQQIAMEVTRQEIILRSVPYSLFREGFVTVAEDQNRDVGRDEEQLVACLDTVTVRQGQLE